MKKDIAICILLDKETDAELKKITNSGLINKSEFVRRALRDYMERQKERGGFVK